MVATGVTHFLHEEYRFECQWNDLKNRYHTKIIIDHSAYDSLSQYVDKIVDACENILEALDPKVQNTFIIMRC